jgi:uncharacterized coiled-coil protein SlyX
MDPKHKPVIIVSAFALVCFAAMVLCVGWQVDKSKRLESRLSSERTYRDDQDQYLGRLQKRFAESQKEVEQLKVTLTLLTETCSSECNNACFSQEK